MKRKSALVFVVDDDPSMRKSLSRLLASAGYEAKVCASAGEFLACALPDCPACLVLDIKMPKISGIDLQKEMLRRRLAIPIIFITGHGTIPMSVSAMKNGAADFLEKPFDRQVLLAAIEKVLAEDKAARVERDAADEIAERFESLTPRERQVLAQVVTGKLNKQIAHELGIVEKTVKVHRARVMEKMKTASLAELVRISSKVVDLSPDK